MQKNSHFDTLVVKDVPCLNLDLTFDCGQCFRFAKNSDGFWEGVIAGRKIMAKIEAGALIVVGQDILSVEKDILRFFDLDTDYAKILSHCQNEPALRDAASYSAGIRILRQQPWEALCSFIISQNNNIPRIKGIIERLCESFGDKIDGGGSFPSPDRLSRLRVEDLAVLRCGFRARYILDAAQKVHSGQVDFDAPASLPIADARAHLMQICGVGPKVADCALLYGFHRLEAFPVDVWMSRALKIFLPDGLPESFSPYAGVVQQYLFHYIRGNYASVSAPDAGIS